MYNYQFCTKCKPNFVGQFMRVWILWNMCAGKAKMSLHIRAVSPLPSLHQRRRDVDEGSVPYGHLLGKGWHFGSRLWCMTVSLLLSMGILGQVWYLIVSIFDLCTLTYFYTCMLYYESLVFIAYASSTVLDEFVLWPALTQKWCRRRPRSNFIGQYMRIWF